MPPSPTKPTSTPAGTHHPTSPLAPTARSVNYHYRHYQANPPPPRQTRSRTTNQYPGPLLPASLPLRGERRNPTPGAVFLNTALECHAAHPDQRCRPSRYRPHLPSGMSGCPRAVSAPPQGLARDTHTHESSPRRTGATTHTIVQATVSPYTHTVTIPMGKGVRGRTSGCCS